MHFELIQDVARERQRDVERALRHQRPWERRRQPAAPGTIVIRLAQACDLAALRRLAALEGRELREGRWLVGEADGSVGAALDLDAGTLLADPFRLTAPLAQVLDLWARQASGGRVGRRRRRLLFV